MVFMIIAGVIGVLLSALVGAIYVIRAKSDIIKECKAETESCKNDIDKLSTENANIVSHRKSSEVRLGKIAENMAPFFDAWPYDPNTFRFLGDPVDGIQFTTEGIIFIEIKSGNARLSKGQKHIKELVKAGKVSFATFRVSEHGTLMKID